MDEKDLQSLENLLDKKLDEKLQPIKETLDSHTVSLLNLEREIKSYMDALDIERKRIDKTDERVKVIEDSLGVST